MYFNDENLENPRWENGSKSTTEAEEINDELANFTRDKSTMKTRDVLERRKRVDANDENHAGERAIKLENPAIRRNSTVEARETLRSLYHNKWKQALKGTKIRMAFCIGEFHNLLIFDNTPKSSKRTCEK